MRWVTCHKPKYPFLRPRIWFTNIRRVNGVDHDGLSVLSDVFLPMTRAKLNNKTCAVCGRMIEWRKKWERDWDQIKYCSQRCRRGGLNETDRCLEATIRELLCDRAAGATICPSDAARRVGMEKNMDWHELMEPARQAARRLVAAGEIEITQKGRVVEPSSAKGPIRLRKSQGRS